MKRAWQVMSLALLGLSIFVLILVIRGEGEYKDELGFGPAFFPVWMGIVTGAASLALFAQTTWGSAAVDNSVALIPDRQGIRRILIILVSLIGNLGISFVMGQMRKKDDKKGAKKA